MLITDDKINKLLELLHDLKILAQKDDKKEAVEYIELTIEIVKQRRNNEKQIHR